MHYVAARGHLRAATGPQAGPSVGPTWQPWQGQVRP